MKELVTEIDSHAELINLKISSNPNAERGQMAQPLLSNLDQVSRNADPHSSEPP